MKIFKVSKTCNACGQCALMTDLLIETADGKAIPSDIGYISDDFLKEAQNIIDICPVGALSIIEVGNVRSSGKRALKELESLLKRRLNEVVVPIVTKGDIGFNANNYFIDFNEPKGDYDYKYSSENKAEKAALDEFNRIAYSQYRAFILSVFVQYKNDKLKQFYTFEANESSFYYKINKKYMDILKEIATEAKALTNGKILLSEEFITFDVYPGNSNKFIRGSIDARLKEFETRSTSSGIMAEFRSNSYSSLDSYSMYIDTDEMEHYEEGMFGRSKIITKYCYKNLNGAVNEYIKDLKSAMNYVDIDESALYDVNEAIDYYEKEIAIAVEQKIKEFSEAVAQI
jgi:ferredoxin